MADVFSLLELLEIDPIAIRDFTEICNRALETAKFDRGETRVIDARTSEGIKNVIQHGCGENTSLTGAILQQIGIHTVSALQDKYPLERFDYKNNNKKGILLVNDAHYYPEDYGGITALFEHYYTDEPFYSLGDIKLIFLDDEDGELRFHTRLSSENLRIAITRSGGRHILRTLLSVAARDENAVSAFFYKRGDDITMSIQIMFKDNSGEPFEYNEKVPLTDDEKNLIASRIRLEHEHKL